MTSSTARPNRGHHRAGEDRPNTGHAHQPLATGILARESFAVCIENADCALTVGPATLDAINAR
jgi:hypothetical protein